MKKNKKSNAIFKPISFSNPFPIGFVKPDGSGFADSVDTRLITKDALGRSFPITVIQEGTNYSIAIDNFSISPLSIDVTSAGGTPLDIGSGGILPVANPATNKTVLDINLKQQAQINLPAPTILPATEPLPERTVDYIAFAIPAPEPINVKIKDVQTGLSDTQVVPTRVVTAESK